MTDRAELPARLWAGIPYWTPPGSHIEQPNVDAAEVLLAEAAARIEVLEAALREARAVVAFEAETRGELDADYDQSAHRALEQIDAALTPESSQ